MSEPDRNEAMRDAARDALRELIPDLIQDLLGSQAVANGHGTHSGGGRSNGGSAHGNRGSVNGHRSPNGQDQSQPDIVPLVPAPPVAAVLRPSTWSGPAVPGEVIGGDGSVPAVESVAPAGAPAPPAGAPVQIAHTPSPTPGPGSKTTQAGLSDGTVETVRIDSDEDLQAFVRSLVTRLESPRDRLAIKAGRLRFHLQRSAGAVSSPSGAAGSDGGQFVRVEKGAATERHVRDAAAHGSRLVLARGAVLTPLARDCARSLGVQIDREGRC